MSEEGMVRGAKDPYVEPRVLATYSKEELAETIRPHGSLPSYDGGEPGCGGCGCGCGCAWN